MSCSVEELTLGFSVTVGKYPNGPALFRVGVAANDADRERGLMFVRHLPDASGLLFVFDDDSRKSFYMRNTLISLDMIFIDRDGYIVDIYECATPLSLESVVSRRGARYVLEVNCGAAERVGLQIGDRLEFRQGGATG